MVHKNYSNVKNVPIFSFYMFLSTSGIGDKQIFSSNFICKNYFWIEISFELFLQIVQIVNRLENC